MSQPRYRLIFSRVREERRASGCIYQEKRYALRPLMTIRSLLRLLALFTGPAVAEGIVADGAAASGQRPQVIATRNGVPQVNITAPNRAGVSHNQYRQFDVGQQGIVLNNSAVTASTRLGGMVQGNPNLTSTGAKVILNEVNNNNPSQLRGLMEVAGSRAQVIVANPAGMVCNGCGTINAGRMTLTTGKPQLNADGGLAGHAVERGVVRIEGDGLNGDARHDTEYVEVLARAVEVNAGIWAKKELTLVAGRNHISADGKRIIVQETDGKPPDLAIDMGHMGGMYSGHIRMIGTETGVGVRNQGGRVQAGKTLTVGSEGKLVWQSAVKDGVTQAGGDVSLAARDNIEYRGRLHGGGRLAVESRTGELKQSGTLSAAGEVRLKGERAIHSHGHVLSGSNAKGQLIHAANLSLTSGGTVRAGGNLLSRKDVDLVGRRVDISQSQLVADRATISARSGGVVLRQATVNSREFSINTTGDVDAQRAQIAAGQWNISATSLFNQQAIWFHNGDGKSRFTLNGALDNRSAAIGSNGDMVLDVGSLNNRNGSISGRSALDLTVGGDIHNARGALLSGDRLTINAVGAVDNGSGVINGGQLQIVTRRLNNTQGELTGQGDLNLSARQRLDNTQGLLAAGEAMSIRTEGQVNNRGGTIQGGRVATIIARAVDNEEGRLLSGERLMLQASGPADNHSGAISGERLELTAKRLDNMLGKIIALRGLNLSLKQALDNTKGLLEAGEALVVRTDGDWDNRGGAAQGGRWVNAVIRRFNNAGGRLQSGGELTLNSMGDVSNQGGRIGALQDLNWQGSTASRLDNDGGSLQSAGDLSLQGGGISNRQSGVVLSQQALSLRLAGDWDNRGGTLSGNGRTRVRAADLHNAQGIVNALDSLDMDFTGKLDNGGGRIFSKRSQSLHAQHIFNPRGRIGSQGSWTAVSDDFNNREGRIQSQRDAAIAATVLDNANGVVQSAGALHLRIMSDADNRGGKLSATGPLNLQGATGESFSGNLNNRGGQLLSGDRLTVAAQGADNQQGGLLYSQKAMRLDFKQELDNRHGRVQSGEGLQLDARSLHNTAGVLDGRQQLKLSIIELLNNDGGAVRSNGDQQIAAGQVANRLGVFSSHRGLSLAAARLDNAFGTLNSQGSGIYRAGWLNNHQGKVHSGDTLTFDAPWLNNRAGQLVSTRMLALNAARFDNRGQGTLSSQAGFDIQADRLDNGDGGILFGTTQGVVTAREVDNSAGRLQSAGSLALSGLTTLDNRRGRILANDNLRINTDTLRAVPALVVLNQAGLVQSGETLSLNTRTLDSSGGTLHGQHALDLVVQQDTLHRGSDRTLEARRLKRLPDEWDSAHDVEKNKDKWQRYDNYLLSWGSVARAGISHGEPTTRQLTLRDNAAAQNDRDSTLLAIDTRGRRVQVRVKDSSGELRDLWIHYLALKPGKNGDYAMTFYETRGWKQNVPTPYYSTFGAETIGVTHGIQETRKRGKATGRGPEDE
ncbi:two-partner secretion domain-containing protein [Erwinia tasmaniensis]|uniref:Filamentous hemagglutinin n=1 Tax=Erwinia tasmaniensis (strain DSM 17950 / CFBP 7177 / CIP 109463 / NCPPB 4357 / Et1/99) TaxID=465817 RepID=B2VKC2_ERWT9|nr:filamentous hemagglutinin N-terminal domain-containing protein [Erwinia tasmaniensis]CAO98129.1 Putative filamentous hemagglutinin [Erwinia tasmaniensis Et1/99]